MLKDFTSGFLRTSLLVVAILTFHTLFGSASPSVTERQDGSTETPAPVQAALFTDSSSGIDDFGLVSEGCSLPHTSLARPTSSRTNVPNSIAKPALANWSILSKATTNLFS